jgi:hypothetical protein
MDVRSNQQTQIAPAGSLFVQPEAQTRAQNVAKHLGEGLAVLNSCARDFSLHREVYVLMGSPTGALTLFQIK